MRLTRHGRKRYAYYHIIVADSRAPRDGRYIERIGRYNPNTNPATIDLDFDKAYDWLTKGAQPTDTVRAILSYKGVLFKKHLMGGVKKGAFSEEEAERRLDNWLTEKEEKIRAEKDNLQNKADAEAKKILAAETKRKEEMAAAVAAKNAELAGEVEESSGEVAEESEIQKSEEEPSEAQVKSEENESEAQAKSEENESEAQEGAGEDETGSEEKSN